MSKKIFHSYPSTGVPSRIMHVDPAERPERRKKKSKEFVDGETCRGKEHRSNRKKVKAEARVKRDTTRNQRRMQKKPVTGIDFQEGDLVYHFKNPNTFMLVTGVTTYRNSQTWVECMVGVDIFEHKALHLRKSDD